jgi:adenylate cyclase
MTIKTLLRVYLFSVVLIASIMSGFALYLKVSFNDLKDAQNNRQEMLLLADELRQSSEDLTKFARSFAATSDPKYLEYFQHILKIRNGEVARPLSYDDVYWDLIIAGVEPIVKGNGEAISLENRIISSGATIEEYSQFIKAENVSNNLSKIERIAQAAVVGQFDDGSGQFVRTSAPDPALAIKLLYSDKYLSDKAKIMQPIDRFTHNVRERTTRTIDLITQDSETIIILSIVVSVLLTFSGFLFSFLINKKVIHRSVLLASTANEVMHGKLDCRSNIKGEDEISAISSALDGMLDRISIAMSEEKSATDKAEKQSLLLSQEKHKSETLLLSILPPAYAERLKKGETPIADTYNEVSVLFLDLVGFTALSSVLPARKIVEMLNDIFGRLDKLTKLYALEKIKTIGDCYMLVGGIPNRDSEHCQKVACFAIDALKEIADYSTSSGNQLQARIGINTGTVVAGVVGTDKFTFDLWGDVVNIASRLESSSEPGKIQVSQAVSFRLQDDFEFQERGMIALKGKGEMAAFYLQSKNQ